MVKLAQCMYDMVYFLFKVGAYIIQNLKITRVYSGTEQIGQEKFRYIMLGTLNSSVDRNK
jgi:hypothetical protein